MRLRIEHGTWPRPGLYLTDTPRPHCRICDGCGGIESFYGDPETGEYAGSDWDPCDCWTQWRCLLLPLPSLPRWLARRPCPADYSDEPPF
ncbi:hypothetical protein [Streptomyces melanogenes]|uniref:hypothetical protein n=1 Tax=Streptomyces melanogenes TaxID=67326 RepID=UPI0019B27855|nr:hypothetical protein [Streptomyces melanogenes]GGP37222.1 hypothetical protein GCM10010278_12740 [Streptomyces melanogenes]